MVQGQVEDPICLGRLHGIGHADLPQADAQAADLELCPAQATRFHGTPSYFLR